MKTREVEVNSGLRYKLPVPESVEEYNTLAKRTDGSNACLDDAVDNTIYRGVLPDAHYATALALQRQHGVPFLMKDHPDGKKDAAGAVIQVRDLSKDSNPKYVSRIAAQLGVEETEFQSLVDELCANGWDEEEEEQVKGPDGKVTTVKKKVHHSLTFDPSVRERQVRIPTPGKQDLIDALELMKDQKILKRAVKKIGETLGKEVVLPVSDGSPEQNTALQTALALAIRDYGHAIAKASKKGLAG